MTTGESLRWGIAGPGGIASRFADDLQLVDDADLVAVASRSLDRATDFAGRFDIARAHGAYEDLAADPDVDIVYVATPAAFHAAHTLLFLEAGKHVLCEKPFALDVAQARRMVEVARRRGLFLMDAMWSRFLPSYRKLLDVLADGTIGDPLIVEADFGFRAPVDPQHRLFDLSLGGGSLLDLGIYPLHLASLVFGAPTRIAAGGNVGTTGVDESVAAILGYQGEEMSVLKSAIRTPMACAARIGGTEGGIELPAFMHAPRSLTVTSLQGTTEIETDWDGDGIRFQVHEVHRCIAEGRTESTAMPLNETVSLVETMDEIRRQLGVTYPSDR